MAYRLRWKRRRLLFRALRKRGELTVIVDRTAQIAADDILCFLTVRNEYQRLPYFLKHYRDLGVHHFFVVDNDSTDQTNAYLSDQADVSLWSTSHSYRLSRFGMDWLTALQITYAHGHWCVTVDADELLIYPNWQSRDLSALAAWLEQSERPNMGAIMLDMYPDGPVSGATCNLGQDPLAILKWFDAGNYQIRVQAKMKNLWIQGGPRLRQFFGSDPRKGPTLNKVPFVKWNRRFVYNSSTHNMLPRRLNEIYATDGGELTSGALLHTKFLSTVVNRSTEEQNRKQHFENSVLYDAYYTAVAQDPTLRSPYSTRYLGWRQLEAFGIISRGGWV